MENIKNICGVEYLIMGDRYYLISGYETETYSTGSGTITVTSPKLSKEVDKKEVELQRIRLKKLKKIINI